MLRTEGMAFTQKAENTKAEPDARFATLLREHRASLYRFALGIADNPTDAEDLAQRTFIQAYRELPSLHHESDPLPWLCGIGWNLANQRPGPYRARNVGRDQPEGVVPAQVGAEAAAPNALVQYMELMTQLCGQIEHLPQELRGAFLLAIIEGHTYEEIAERLAVPFGTVRNHLQHACKIIEARLPELLGSLMI